MPALRVQIPQVHQWQVRHCGVLSARPLLTQQDHIVFHILLTPGSGQLRDNVDGHIAVGPHGTLRAPIFARCLGVNTDACGEKLRTLAGMENFARTNAHFFRWDTHPTLRYSACERLCLHCLLDLPDQRLHSEWHAFLDCPLTEKAPREFVLLTNLEVFMVLLVLRS